MWWAANKRDSSRLPEQFVLHCYTCNSACRSIVAFSRLTVHFSDITGEVERSHYYRVTIKMLVAFHDKQPRSDTCVDGILHCGG
jgi:hypothetical protein